MNKREKSILLTLVAIITILLVYLIFRFSTSDTALSIVPSWNTTIYPPEITWTILTILLILSSLLVYFLYKGIIKGLTLLWKKLKLSKNKSKG